MGIESPKEEKPFDQELYKKALMYNPHLTPTEYNRIHNAIIEKYSQGRTGVVQGVDGTVYSKNLVTKDPDQIKEENERFKGHQN